MPRDTSAKKDTPLYKWPLVELKARLELGEHLEKIKYRSDSEVFFYDSTEVMFGVQHQVCPHFMLCFSKTFFPCPAIVKSRMKSLVVLIQIYENMIFFLITLPHNHFYLISHYICIVMI